MKLEDKIQKLREDALKVGTSPVAGVLQGVTRDRIARVLAMIDRESADTMDAVFALLAAR